MGTTWLKSLEQLVEVEEESERQSLAASVLSQNILITSPNLRGSNLSNGPDKEIDV